jgi:hypothetical protein
VCHEHPAGERGQDLIRQLVEVRRAAHHRGGDARERCP